MWVTSLKWQLIHIISIYATRYSFLHLTSWSLNLTENKQEAGKKKIHETRNTKNDTFLHFFNFLTKFFVGYRKTHETRKITLSSLADLATFGRDLGNE